MKINTFISSVIVGLSIFSSSIGAVIAPFTGTTPDQLSSWLRSQVGKITTAQEYQSAYNTVETFANNLTNKQAIATVDELQNAQQALNKIYRSASLVFHPDKQANADLQSSATDYFKQLQPLLTETAPAQLADNFVLTLSQKNSAQDLINLVKNTSATESADLLGLYKRAVVANLAENNSVESLAQQLSTLRRTTSDIETELLDRAMVAKVLSPSTSTRQLLKAVDYAGKVSAARAQQYAQQLESALNNRGLFDTLVSKIQNFFEEQFGWFKDPATEKSTDIRPSQEIPVEPTAPKTSMPAEPSSVPVASEPAPVAPEVTESGNSEPIPGDNLAGPNVDSTTNQGRGQFAEVVQGVPGYDIPPTPEPVQSTVEVGVGVPGYDIPPTI